MDVDSIQVRYSAACPRPLLLSLTQCLLTLFAVPPSPGLLRLQPVGQDAGVRVTRCPTQDVTSIDSALLHAMEGTQHAPSSQSELQTSDNSRCC